MNRLTRRNFLLGLSKFGVAGLTIDFFLDNSSPGVLVGPGEAVELTEEVDTLLIAAPKLAK